MKYCKYCGHKKEEVEGKYYNEHTGEKEKIVVCVNKECPTCCRKCGAIIDDHQWLPGVCKICFITK